MIEITDLTKRFGALTAVDHLSFSVQPGEVLGFLGPNGAGKSTTMKMIAGFLAPDAGTVKLAGHDVQREPLAAKRALGYLPEGAPSYGEMTPRAFLEFIADIRGLSGSARKQRMAMVVEQLHLEKVLEQTIDTLSKGFKRRVGIAQAMLHDPKVLILDEPTDGLDPNQKHEVRSLINSMAKDKIIVISTHILEEVAAVCSRAIIIAQGRILADATPAELIERSNYHQAVAVETDDATAVREAVKDLPQVKGTELDGRRVIVLSQQRKPILEPVRSRLAERGVRHSNLWVETGRLDDVFRRVTKGEERFA